MAATPSTYQVAQFVGITGAAWLSGNIASVSLFTVPALRTSASKDGVPLATLAKQWRYVYDAGKSKNPPIAVATALSFIYLAWSARTAEPPNLALLYGSAAACTVAVIPFTLVIMGSAIHNLRVLSEGSTGARSMRPNEDDFDGLLMKWSNLNYVRAVLPLIATIIALVAVL
ncbi:hypothetical protein EDB80DRAFT_874634 [Ilyonectria destructans]|nr:hypothetical protein EDB80DRAFT_874634 [Ilyonectria destructans]